jgi:uncharacterized RDD family membrane protein YckC
MQKRFTAFIFDYFCFAILFGAYFYLFRIRTESGFQVVGLQHLAILLVAWFLWIPFIESQTGQTVGKKFLRITVVNSSGEKPSLEECVKRHVLDMLDIIFLSTAPFLFKQNNSVPRRLGDYFAKTWVINLQTATA